MDWEAFYSNFRSPEFIPGYELQNRLGGGAFGDVYKARKQSIGKAYAIKFLKVEDESQREAVKRELDQVRHFAAIDHPNLVTIEDMGTVMEVPYLIMGYAGEDTLARRLKEGALEAEDALLYFVQGCRGVLALHDRRLVHFDLKPSNIFLKGEVARVGDYGLSKLLTDGRMTLSFGRGTPQYMAPEILRSRADHRADIYSLGVILYETLVGRLPFEPETEGGLVLREEDVPPSFPESFPENLVLPVSRCLRLDPTDRFQNVGELLDSLGQPARQGDSVSFETPTPTPVVLTQDEDSDVNAPYRRLEDGDAQPEEPPPPPPRPARHGTRPPYEDPTPAESRMGKIIEPMKQSLEHAGQELKKAGEELKRAGVKMAESPGVQQAKEKVEAGAAIVRDRDRREVALARAKRRLKSLKRTRPVGAAAAKKNKDAKPVNKLATAPVPVPPRVEGGIFATVWQTIVVGFEVLAALFGSVLKGIVRAYQRVVQVLLRGNAQGLVGRAFGWMGFLAVMAGLGFTVMVVGMLFIDAVD